MTDKKYMDDLRPDQEKLLKELISKEMMKKIERRIDGSDNSVMKTLRTFLDDETVQKPKPGKNAAKVLEAAKRKSEKE